MKAIAYLWIIICSAIVLTRPAQQELVSTHPTYWSNIPVLEQSIFEKPHFQSRIDIAPTMLVLAAGVIPGIIAIRQADDITSWIRRHKRKLAITSLVLVSLLAAFLITCFVHSAMQPPAPLFGNPAQFIPPPVSSLEP